MIQKLKIVRILFLILLVVLLIQVALGGITRLTGSGLSITKWDLVTGTVPPLNQTDWNTEFDLYKATPQYALINQGMTLPEFQYIYFWEWAHRLWGRLGFLFALAVGAYLFFGLRLGKQWMLRLLWFLLLYVGQGVVGWVMVLSGLVDIPYVSHIRLTAHLLLALVLIVYTVHLLLKTYPPSYQVGHKKMHKFSITMLILLLIQITYGGFMSGLRAAMEFPSWPSMNGSYVPSNLLLQDGSFLESIIVHKPMIQFIHRNWGYLIFIVIWIAFFQLKNKIDANVLRRLFHWLPIIVTVQALLGVLTLLLSKQGIPVAIGVLHQIGGILLFCYVYILYFKSKEAKILVES